MAIFAGLGERSLDFTVRVWSNDFDDRVTTRSDPTTRVCDALAAGGTEIPFPLRDPHLRTVFPKVRAGLGGAGSPRAA